MKIILFILSFGLISSSNVVADVVKPALVEINVSSEKVISIEVRASIEALLTGINSTYKNTQDAPNAEEYDEFRQMPASELEAAFDEFKEKFIDSIYLKTGNDILPLQIVTTNIPPTGYTKVPRISVILLQTQLPASATTLQWYYPEKFGDNAVRLKQMDKENGLWHWSQWQWLKNDAQSTPFSLTEIVARQDALEVIATYIILGFEHILPRGLDHILFILGLFLLSTHWRPLLWQVTMFTVAHTITLGLAMNNIVELPAYIVEPLIALSIAYVGIENVYAKHLNKSRLILVFVFGLIHGLGFASVLSDFGMPETDFFTALISFNVGVELGQIATILLAFVLVGYWLKDRDRYRQLIVLPGSVFISVIGLYWFVDRLVIF